MKFNLFKKHSSSFLGIDIGMTGIRIVQLGLCDKNIILENYVSIKHKNYLEVLGNGEKLNSIRMSEDEIVKDLKKVIEKSEITLKKVIMSVHVSSSFSSIMFLPEIPEGEISKAVNFEARKYIPIPISEVSFGWTIIGKEMRREDDAINNSKKIKKIKILLVAIPKETTDKYTRIVSALGLKLIALETESFSLARSLTSREKGISTIVDIGDRTTSVTIVKNGSVVGSHVILGIGGKEITKIIGNGFNVDFDRAENLKINISSNTKINSEKKIFEITLPVINIIISEIKKINESYSRVGKKNIDRIILTGGTASLSGLVSYFSKEFNIPVEIGNPWKNIVYDKNLDRILKENSPFFTIAVGLALRGFEE